MIQKPAVPSASRSEGGAATPPFGSPSARKRQPLRESRRVSIEKTGMYLQLNQYRLMDAIGQVGARVGGGRW